MSSIRICPFVGTKAERKRPMTEDFSWPMKNIKFDELPDKKTVDDSYDIGM